MRTELIEYLRTTAHRLIMMGRRLGNDEASELEGIAIELLKRAREFENDSRW